MDTALKVYISSSWKNRARVRAMADAIRASKHEVYDFTDSRSREGIPELPPEKFPRNFDPTTELYRNYLNTEPVWRQAVMRNQQALKWCNVVLLLLPSGLDAHADAFYGHGKGALLAIVGQPRAGERTPTHLWADVFLDGDDEVVNWLGQVMRDKQIHGEIL